MGTEMSKYQVINFTYQLQRQNTYTIDYNRVEIIIWKIYRNYKKIFMKALQIIDVNTSQLRQNIWDILFNTYIYDHSQYNQ